MKITLFHLLPRSIAGAGLAVALSFSSSTPADAGRGHDGGGPGPGAPLTGIYAFGDSLVDTGNFFNLTGLPPEPYFEGRFSNGLIWVDYLAEELGLDPDDVANYAVGGATTGRDNENDIPGVVEFPGLQDELDVFESDLNGMRADRRALYIVWAGANDFFLPSDDPFQTIATGIENTVIAVQRLHNVGARRIMVVNLPDLGLTPLGEMSGNAGGLSFLSAAYNENLGAALDLLDMMGVETIRLDSAAIIQDMVASPGEYDFSNVSDPYLETGGDPSGFLFWDAVHPTTHGHFFVAEEAMRVLRSEFRHAWVTPRNRQRARSHSSHGSGHHVSHH